MALVNNPQMAGQLAGRKELFGEASRYAVAPVHTRFDCLMWFTWDAEQEDEETCLPSVIRQELSREQAIEGLA